MASEVARGSSRRGRDRDILRGDKINWPWRLNAVVVCIGAIGSVWMLFGWGGRSFFFRCCFCCVCAFLCSVCLAWGVFPESELVYSSHKMSL